MKANIKTRIPTIVATALILTGVWGASSAFAAEQVRSERVKFADLNVETPEGVQVLYSRIHAAAKRVCSESDPVLKAAENICISKADGDAIAKLDLPQLTAYYQIKTRTSAHAQPLVAAR